MSKSNQLKLKRNEKMAKTKNRIKKMNFQSQTRTDTPLTEEDKYLIHRLVKERDRTRIDYEELSRITGRGIRPQHI